MIWRDDDISVITKLESFRFVHGIFQSFGVVHTIAVIAKDIQDNPELVKFIKDRPKEFSVQLHCYEHFDHAKDEKAAVDSIMTGSKIIQEVFGSAPTIWFPPWNSCTENLKSICKSIGLTARPDKISLDQYIRKSGAVAEDVINFHYWHEPEVNDLYKALKIYKG